MNTQKKTVASPFAMASSLTINRFFHIAERGLSVAQEVRGGSVTFFAMTYILVVNPIILSIVLPAETGFAFTDTVVGIALVAGIVTTLMGPITNLSLTFAAGVNPNAVIVFTLAGNNGLSYQEAMGLIVREGILIAILVLTGFRKTVFEAIPRQLKTVTPVGIGPFIVFVGPINAGIIRPGGTPTQLGIDGSLTELPALVFVFRLLLTVVLYIRKVKGATLTNLLSSAILAIVFQAIFYVPAMKDETGEIVNLAGWGQTIPELFGLVVSLPSSGSSFRVDMFGIFSKLGPVAVVLLIFSLILVDFFDTIGTMVAIGGKAKPLDENDNPSCSREILLVDSLAAIVGDVGDVSPSTSYIRSSASVGGGTRTSLASVMTGLLFLASTFFSPLVTLVPTEATSTVLVFVDFLMMMQVVDIDWSKAGIAVPTFLMIALMPLAYSITVGIGVGFVTYTLIRIVKDQVKRVRLLMWLVSILFIVYFLFGPIEVLIG